MGSFKDKFHGVVDKTTGKLKERMGRATNDRDLEQEGQVENIRGKVEKTTGDVKDKIADTVENEAEKIRRAG